MFLLFLFTFLKNAQCITEAAAGRCFVQRLLFTLTVVKADDKPTDKFFHGIFREIFQNIKPSFLYLLNSRNFLTEDPYLF